MSNHLLYKKQSFKDGEKEDDFHLWVAKLSQHED